jgi:hypothetical protein
MMAMFVCVVLIAGGGYYYTTTLEEEEDGEEKKTGSCQGTDANAVYEYDENEDCAFKKCKDGYMRQSGYCIRQRDYTADFNNGSIPVNCEITNYIEGACLDSNGRQLTGEPGRCGTGTKRFTADPTGFTIANSLGECENFSYTEPCEVECKEVGCSATRENYTKTDGVCRGMDGDPIGGDTNRCGTGYQIYEVDPATAGNFASDELRDAWVADQWKDCTPLKVPCEVICEPDMEPSGCPELSEDMETSYVVDANGEKACIPKAMAVALLKGDARYDSGSMPMPKLTRAAARDAKIYSMAELPEGYSIKFKTGAADFKELTLKGCATAQLEPCRQPTENEDCTTRDEVVQACYDVGCGERKKMKIRKAIAEEAWGTGQCDVDLTTEDEVECEQATVMPCCSADIDEHWTTPTGSKCSALGFYPLQLNKAICSTTGIPNSDYPSKTQQCCYIGDWVEGACNEDRNRLGQRKYTRSVVNGELCNPINPTTEEYKTEEACNYIEGVSKIILKYGGQGGAAILTVHTLSSGIKRLNANEDNPEATESFDTPQVIKYFSGSIQDYSGYGRSYVQIQFKDSNDRIFKTFSKSGVDSEVVYFTNDKPGHGDLVIRD